MTSVEPTCQPNWLIGLRSRWSQRCLCVIHQVPAAARGRAADGTPAVPAHPQEHGIDSFAASGALGVHRTQGVRVNVTLTRDTGKASTE